MPRRTSAPKAREPVPTTPRSARSTIQSGCAPGDLDGSIYLGEPKPGNQYRLFLLADGFGIHAKLLGKLIPDPQTGQLTAEFDDLPQVPFEKFEIHLFASDRGILATPTQCAVYAVDTHLYPWNAEPADQQLPVRRQRHAGPERQALPGRARAPSPPSSRPAPPTPPPAPSLTSP